MGREKLSQQIVFRQMEICFIQKAPLNTVQTFLTFYVYFQRVHNKFTANWDIEYSQRLATKRTLSWKFQKFSQTNFQQLVQAGTDGDPEDVFQKTFKSFKFPASCPENDRDFGLRSIGCRHLCSESISPPPCADPGGFQVMKAQIQRGVIFAIIFSKNLPVCKPQGLHPPWPPWWGCWPPSRSAPWPCSPPRTRTPPSWASPGCCSQPDLPHILEGQSPAHCQSHNHRDPGMRASKHPFSAWNERWRSYCSIRTKGILSNEEKDQTRGQTSQSAG